MSRGAEQGNREKSIQKVLGKWGVGAGRDKNRETIRPEPNPVENHIKCTCSKDPSERQTASLDKNTNLSHVHL